MGNSVKCLSQGHSDVLPHQATFRLLAGAILTEHAVASGIAVNRL